MKSNSEVLKEMQSKIRRRGMAYRTEKNYLQWARRFASFHSGIRLVDMGKPEIEEYLNDLVNERNVASSTHNQALSALVLLFRDVLGMDTGGMKLDFAKKSKSLPAVLSVDEVRAVLSAMRSGVPKRITWIMYGTGMRVNEALRLRVNDLDFGNEQIYIRNAKGAKDRVVMMPKVLITMLQKQVDRVRNQHGEDLAIGEGRANLPTALADKYPNAALEFGWQFLFPSVNLSKCPRKGTTHRHHVSSSMVNKAIKKAVWRAKISKRVTAHTFRHSFATHSLQDGCDIRTLQQLLGHKHLKTTMRYTHVMQAEKAISPADRLAV